MGVVLGLGFGVCAEAGAAMAIVAAVAKAAPARIFLITVLLPFSGSEWGDRPASGECGTCHLCNEGHPENVTNCDHLDQYAEN
ncbi:hypothetical protein GCM10010289_00960 [Streptomyces violascens]|nr:hypothetical protein GCM10010289_00960 [Streptomyces violascens]